LHLVLHEFDDAAIQHEIRIQKMHFNAI